MASLAACSTWGGGFSRARESTEIAGEGADTLVRPYTARDWVAQRAVGKGAKAVWKAGRRLESLPHNNRVPHKRSLRHKETARHTQGACPTKIACPTKKRTPNKNAVPHKRSLHHENCLPRKKNPPTRLGNKLEGPPHNNSLPKRSSLPTELFGPIPRGESWVRSPVRWVTGPKGEI